MELVEEFPEDLADKRSPITVGFMKKAGTYFCKKVGMDAESAVGDYWIH